MAEFGGRYNPPATSAAFITLGGSMNTIELVRIPAMTVPDKECLVFEDRRFTYRQLLDRILRLAAALHARGIRRGDKVAILHTNSNEYVEAYYAVAMLGAIFVPLNYRARADELVHLVNDSESSTLFVGDRYVEQVRSLASQFPNVTRYIAVESPQEGMEFFGDLLASASPDDAPEIEVDDSDCTILMYTSGTTALPKGVILTYGGFSEYILTTTEPASEESTGATLLAVPIYHVAGASAIMTALYGGRKLVLMRQFDPKEWLRLVERERITNVFLVPTMMKRIIDDPDFDKYDLSSLQFISYGAAPMPVPVILKAIAKFPKHVGFMNAFGQTETTSTVTILGPEDHRLEGTPEEIERKIGRLHSIGRPVDDVELAILDEEGNPLPVGVVGEIAIRTPREMAGYWKQEEATAKTKVGGWIRTRDQGYIDEDGYVFLAGRKSDMIIRGGENIAPEEVERILHGHPAIEEVAVIGVPDEEWGERVKAVVVLREGAHCTHEEIIAYAKTRLASFKVPEIIEFVETLPRNAMGKVLKNVLREQHRLYESEPSHPENVSA
ncbi:MAG: long-chain-fatty-acid--CoA ligase [Chloroflexota bacterium]|nr:long-chain-fatty-acid--CoA ligase [Dehalococcoidia bacterium]MDW8254231.1 long-chain-fatty-acid--CoA ligase [Chloroflexota bacterium]